MGRVIRFNYCCGDLWSWVNRKFQFGFLSVIHGESLHQKGGESRSGSAPKGMEDKEALKTSAVVSQFPDPNEYKIHDLFSDGIVTTCVVVSSILGYGTKL